MSGESNATARPRVTVLATKLHIPKPRPSLVPRQRLVQRLADGLARPLILISAPAGFGKTTLVSEWIAGTPGLQSAWLSLDEDDNDPVRFLAGLISALDTLQPGIGASALDLLASPQPLPSKTVLSALINGLAVLNGDFALVLDDYHVLTEPAIHAALAYLIDHQPAQMHLAILSRTDPPMPLARLRARGQLLELRQTDLRFTAEEAAAFLNQTMKLNVSPGEVAALEAHTEGWIAGLQLAALCLVPASAAMGPDSASPEQDRASALLAALSSSNRFILDYLVEEVLARQPSHIQRFLLRTSILDQLCGPLCDAVLGEDGRVGPSQAILEVLEQLNLFIVPLDYERRWYRYHHLFAEFLRSRLRQLDPSLLPELHCRASAWYEHNDYPGEAIGHALDAADWERAARLIERVAQDVLMRGQVATLSGWLEALPEDVLLRRPRLSVFYAWVLAISGRLAAAQSQLLQAEQAVRDMRDTSWASQDMPDWRQLQAQINTAQAFVALYAGTDISRAVELARQALRELPAVDPFLSGLVAFVAGLAAYMDGDVSSAGRAFEESIEIGQATGNMLIAQMAVYGAGYRYMMQGRLHQARDTFRRGLRLSQASTASGQPAPVTAVVYQALGELLREWNDLDGAERNLFRAAELGEQVRSSEMMVDGQISLARVRQARGDPAGATRALGPALAWIRGAGMLSVWTARQVMTAEARLQLQQGNLAAVERWADGLVAVRTLHSTDTGFAATWVRALEDLTLARLWLAQEKYDDAEELLRPLLVNVSSPDWASTRLEALALLALALEGQADSAGALAALHDSLALAQPEGYARVYLDEGAPMAALLRRFASTHGEPRDHSDRALVAYASRLLSQFTPSSPAGAPAPVAIEDSPGTPSGPAEALSARELEVLSLVAAGLSTRQIAVKLVISDGTVKRHINNIHGKLDVHSRTQAIARARELHILEPL